LSHTRDEREILKEEDLLQDISANRRIILEIYETNGLGICEVDLSGSG
jgi:hypothetical protein